MTSEAIVDWERHKKALGKQKRSVKSDERGERKERKEKKRQKKSKRDEQHELRNSALEFAGEPSSPSAQLVGSQPLLPINQKRRIHSPISKDAGPATKRRRLDTPETPQSRSASPGLPVKPAGKAIVTEIKDSYEEDLQFSSGNQHEPRVEIGPVSDSFNPDEYQRVAASQASQAAQSTGSLTNSSHLSSPTQLSPRPQRKHKPQLRERLIFWEEDFEGEVPDSQEQPRSLSYVLRETQAAKSQSESYPSIDINTQADLGTTLLSSSNDISSNGEGIVIDSNSVAGSSSYHPSTNFLKESGHTSTTEEPSKEAPSTGPALESTQEITQGSQLQISSSSAKVSEDTHHSQSQEEEIPDAQPHDYGSLSGFPFQTQISLPTSAIDPLPNLSNNLSNSPRGSVIQSVEHPPHTPPRVSSSNMEDRSPSAPPSTSTTQLLREARARATAKRAAERAAERELARSASTMPATPPPAIGAQLLPLRETLTEHIPPIPVVEPVEPVFSPKPSPEADEESVSKALRICPLTPNEYIIPLPLVSYSRDIYMQTIRNYKNQRLAFLEDETSPGLVAEIDAMLDELGKLCDHQDLIAEDFSSQRAEPIENQARYAETVSTKCIFLAEFITAIRSSDKHVVIISRAGRLQEIVETLLSRHGFIKASQEPNQFTDASGGPLRITLIPSDDIEESIWSNPADLIVSFNELPGPQYNLRATRATTASLGQLVPLVTLVIMNSVEHLSRCIKDNAGAIEKRLFLVNCISQIQDDVGKLGPDNLAPPGAAQATASFLMGETEGVWPVPELPEIHGIDFEISPSPTESGQGEVSGSTTQSYDVSSSSQPSSAKRQLVGYTFHIDPYSY